MSRRQKLSGGARLYSNRRTCSLLLTFMPKKPRWKSRIAAQQSVSLSQIGIAAGILRREAFFIGNCFFDCLLGGGIGHGRHQGNRRHARDCPRARDPGGLPLTSFAFILGCVPLWIATGAGSVARQIMGTTVIGGMLAASVIGIFFVPAIFFLVEKWSGASKEQSPTALPGTPAPAEGD